MSAQDRLAAALEAADCDPDNEHHDARFATAILAADPTLAQDIEDGRALRELRAALPDGWWLSVHVCAGDPHLRVRDALGQAQVSYHSATIAEAADACRKALEAR